MHANHCEIFGSSSTAPAAGVFQMFPISIGRHCVHAVVLSATVLIFSATARPRTAGTDIQTPVVYGRGMLVLVCEKGVAAVRILKPSGSANETGNGLVRVGYQWRFLPANADQGGESAGSGKVLAKLVDGRSTKTSSELNCGPVTVVWSRSDAKTGLIQFDPEQLKVYSFEERQFAGDPHRDQLPLALETFLSGTSTNTKPDEDTEDSQVASLVLYKDMSTIIQGPDGIAVVEFGEVFDRERPPLEEQYGVRYSFTYIAKSGATQTGDGEVYESYKNKMYNGAGSDLVLRAGPNEIVWSRGGDDDGFLYYDPNHIRIQTCNAADTDKLLRVLKEDR